MPLSKLNSFVHYSEISVRLIFTIMKIKMMSFVFLCYLQQKGQGFFLEWGGGFKKKGSPYPVLNFFVFNTVLAESLLFAAVI